MNKILWPDTCYLCNELLPQPIYGKGDGWAGTNPKVWFIKGVPVHKECFDKELPNFHANTNN